MIAEAPESAIAEGLRELGDAPLCVAFSGGLDSTVLLNLLARQRPDGLRAVHVDHGLQAASARWAEHCQRVAEALGVPLSLHRVQVQACGDGPEAAARRARYAAFAAELGDGEYLALAHHRDDQLETLWLRARRGAGVDGLCGMPVRRPLGRGWLWRPLLGLPRAALHAWALHHGLHWIEDPHNRQRRFARVQARLDRLPALRRHWRDLDRDLLRWAEANRRLSTALAAWGECWRVRLGDASTIDLDALMAAPPLARVQALRAWTRGRHLPPLTEAAVRRIERELAAAREDAAPCLHWHGYCFRRYRRRLYLEPAWPEPPADAGGRLSHGRHELPAGAGVLEVDGPLQVDDGLAWRFARGGERIRPRGTAQHRRLKHLFQEAGWPPWQRRRTPLLILQGQVAAVPGLCETEAFGDWCRARGLRIRWSGPAGS